MKEENLLKKLWGNERTRAGLKLIIWLAAIFLVLATMSLISHFQSPKNSNSKDKTIQTITFETMQKELLTNNFEYIYNITTNSINLKYHGKKAQNQEIGLKQSTEGIIKYYINDNTNYQVNMSEIQPIDNLFAIINPDFINLDYIFNLINSLTPIMKTTTEIKYNTIINSKEYTIDIKNNLENITSITIISDLENYQLEFKNIAKIAISGPSDEI